MPTSEMMKSQSIKIRRRATVAEVAREAAVSRAAVYAVLNASKKTNIMVSEATSKHIQVVAERLGYIRNETARSLKMGKTHTIGVVVSSLKSNFFANFLSFLDNVCNDNGYTVFFSSSENDSEREARQLKAMLSKSVDAVVLARCFPGANERLLKLFATQGIPVIILGEDDVVETAYSKVAFDEPAIGKITADYLWSLNHRRVGFLHYSDAHNLSTRVHKARFSSFVTSWSKKGGGEVASFETVDMVHGGEDAMVKLTQLPRTQWPSAIVCSCDQLAISLVQIMRNKGISVPKEISVLGCDDIEAAAECYVPLSTIRLSTVDLAKNTWKLLSRRLINAAGGEVQPESFIVEPSLVIRDSVIAV